MEFLHHIEDAYIWPFIENIYNTFQWLGVVIMMAIESACIPLPSEIIMPFAGAYLVNGGGDWVGILLAGFYGALGCTIGSILAYWVGAKGGRPIVEKYGKYVLINKHHLHTADKWFEKHGEATAFFSRLIPVVRTFISFPAGVARMNFAKFVIYTFLGSFPWSAGLAWAGAVWNPRDIRNALRPFDIPIILVILALIAWFVIRSLRNRRLAKTEAA
ncbi:MAG TPA: DedA family protein [Chloroflexia bacterium]|nr:DedA family protein [Chloroflexia bacterium]